MRRHELRVCTHVSGIIRGTKYRNAPGDAGNIPRADMRGIAPMPHNRTPNVVCKHCGESFRVPPSMVDRYRFCSRECRKASRTRLPLKNDEGSYSIPLSDGQLAIVDAESIHLVSGHFWSPAKSGQTTYAQTHGEGDDGQRVTVQMHRLILGLAPGDPDVDHIDGNGLNNRRMNLRLATASQNCANKRTGQSGYRGVFPSGAIRWYAAIKVNQKEIYLGSCDSPEDAARRYDKAARKYFGEFARLNFPMPHERGVH